MRIILAYLLRKRIVCVRRNSAFEGVAMFVYLVSRSADHTGETRAYPGTARVGWFSRLIALFSVRR